jgi:hypothetical protein
LIDPANRSIVSAVSRRLLLSAVFLLETLIVYFGLTEQFPTSADDFSYEYQARLLAAGQLYAEDPLYDRAHPLHKCVTINNITDYNGHRFSKYPPGWPGILAVGVALKVPWLVDPVLGALLFFLIAGYVERRMGKELVITTWLLLTTCLFFVYYAASLRAHIATALFLFAAFLTFDAAERCARHARLWLFFTGALLGYSSMIRYIDWFPLGAWIGISLLRRRGFVDLVVFAVAFLLLAAGNLPYDMVLSGYPFRPPAALSDPSGMGGMADRLAVSPFGFVQTGVRLANLIWIFPPALLLVLFWRRYRPTFQIKMYIVLFLMNIGIYFFYPAAGGGPGPRYLLACFPFLVLAVVDLYRWICDEGSARTRKLWRLGMISLVVGNLTFAGLEGYTMYWRRDLERTVQQVRGSKNIFFLKTGTFRTDADDLTRNPPKLSAAENLYSNWCDRPTRDAFVRRFPGRKVFVYEYPGHLWPYIPTANATSM